MIMLVDENEVTLSEDEQLFRLYTTKILAMLYHQHPCPLDIDVVELTAPDRKAYQHEEIDIIQETIDVIFFLIINLRLIMGEYKGNGIFKECILTPDGLRLLKIPAEHADGLYVTTGEKMLMAFAINDMQTAIDTLGTALMFDGNIH